MAKALKTLVDEALLTVPEVDVHHARKMIEEPAEAGTGWLILDVREPEEYAAGHLPGAINVPRGTLEVAADHDHPKRDERLQNRHRKILCYCGGGFRSALAARTLQEMGFQEAVSMRGGYTDWTAQKA